MGLISDALIHTEGRTPLPPATPMILPYPSNASSGPDRQTTATAVERSANRETPPGQVMSVKRFAFPALPPLLETEPPSDSSLVTWPKCNDAEVAQACAATADEILQHAARVVLLTSPCDGDGKTSVLVALAPQLARRIEGDILVADANLHKPDLTARLGLPSVEAGGRSALIYPTSLPRLSVLPASRPTGASSPGFDHPWIEELREQWSFVLLDGASLAHAEVAPLASCCDGVYLVVRLGHTPRRAVADAARVIRSSGGRLLGCVVVN